MILGSPTLKVSVRHKFISLILCKKSGIGYDRSKINFYKKVYIPAHYSQKEEAANRFLS